MSATVAKSPAAAPRSSAMTVVELLKPITWFAPMWAFACGVISAGQPVRGRWLMVAAGIALAGPLVTGMSQAANDWFDRHVDAINEPNRPIPSGRLPGRTGLWIALGWTALSLVVSMALGPWVFIAALLGTSLAWAYSAPPLRLKENGWWGNTACAVCYEGLPWFTGAAIMAGHWPSGRIVLVALLYSAGAHGIMTLNDFKSVEGDRRMGVNSLPVLLGVAGAARLACIVMAVPQVAVVALLASWGFPLRAAVIAALVLVQVGLMLRFLRRPRELAPWYNGTGTALSVAGMMVTAFALSAAAAP